MAVRKLDEFGETPTPARYRVVTALGSMSTFGRTRMLMSRPCTRT